MHKLFVYNKVINSLTILTYLTDFSFIFTGEPFTLEACRSERPSNREMMTNFFIEVSNAFHDLYSILHCCYTMKVLTLVFFQVLSLVRKGDLSL